MPGVINATAVLADTAAFTLRLAERSDYLRTIVQETILKGGSTTNLGRMEQPGETAPATGFLVGGIVKSTVIKRGTRPGTTAWDQHETLAVNDLALFIAANAYLLANGTAVRAQGRSYYLGTWVDESTGDVHLDVSEYYVSEGSALTVAEDRGELAIWDLGAEASVLTSHGKAA